MFEDILSKRTSGKLKIGRICRDDTMPLSIYWHEFMKALSQHADIYDDPDPSYIMDLYLPYEDIANESNWPKYSTKAMNDRVPVDKRNLLRGQVSRGDYLKPWEKNGQFNHYLSRVIEYAVRNPTHPIFIINLHPFLVIEPFFSYYPNIISARSSLGRFDVSLMPFSISFPALPVQQGQLQDWMSSPKRPLLASFQGTNTHEVREELAKYHKPDIMEIRVYDLKYRSKLILDAQTMPVGDPEYVDLMKKSKFALIPRGDAHFSYRLLEAMSFGAIPVVISDGWVLPFHRSVPWHKFSIHLPSDRIKFLEMILKRFNDEALLLMQQELKFWYEHCFLNLDRIIAQTFVEIDEMVKQSPKIDF